MKCFEQTMHRLFRCDLATFATQKEKEKYVKSKKCKFKNVHGGFSRTIKYVRPVRDGYVSCVVTANSRVLSCRSVVGSNVTGYLYHRTCCRAICLRHRQRPFREKNPVATLAASFPCRHNRVYLVTIHRIVRLYAFFARTCRSRSRSHLTFDCRRLL